MRRPVLISTDLDRTLIFSARAIAQLGGALPSCRVEDTGRDSDAELSRDAARELAALPRHAVICPATSRNLARLSRLRLPFAVPYAIAANGGVVLADGGPDAGWAARIGRLLAAAAPAAEIRPILAGGCAGRGAGAGVGGCAGADDGRWPPWLMRTGEPDDMCCLAIVDETRLPAAELAAITAGCAGLGWRVSLTGRKLYAYPAGFGKEHAVAYVAERLERAVGAAPVRLAAGDTEHDRAMLAAAERAWVPAGSDLARVLTDGGAGSGSAGHGGAGPGGAGPGGPAPGGAGPGGTGRGGGTVTAEPGHAAAAEITRNWREFCTESLDLVE